MPWPTTLEADMVRVLVPLQVVSPIPSLGQEPAKHMGVYGLLLGSMNLQYIYNNNTIMIKNIYTIHTSLQVAKLLFPFVRVWQGYQPGMFSHKQLSRCDQSLDADAYSTRKLHLVSIVFVNVGIQRLGWDTSSRCLASATGTPGIILIITAQVLRQKCREQAEFWSSIVCILTTSLG